MSVRVGIDLVSVASVRAAIDAHGERYLKRIYTECELRDCATPDGVDPGRLAARFAAKEATMKVLRRADEALAWNAIGVRNDPSGWPDLELGEEAAALARDATVTELSVSLTHEEAYAGAVVIAELGAGAPGR